VPLQQPDTALPAGSSLLPAAIVETIWFNALWFQSIWFLAVLGRDTLLLIPLSLLILHFALVRDRQRELERVATVAIIGITIDTLLSASGVFIFPNDSLLPLWHCCLWLALAAALPRSLAFLQRNIVLPIVLGGLVVPLNYWAGARFGAVEFGYPLLTTLPLLALIWALLLPGLLWVSGRVDASARDGAGP